MRQQNIFQAIIGLLIFFMVQAIVIALIIGALWKFILFGLFGFQITFLQWVALIFVFNLIRFNLLNFVVPPTQMNIDKKEEDNEVH